MSKSFCLTAAASLLTLVSILVQLIGLLSIAEEHCGRMEHVGRGQTSSPVPFKCGRLEVEFVLLNSSSLVIQSTDFLLEEGGEEVAKVIVIESPDNVLEDVRVYFCVNGTWEPQRINETAKGKEENTLAFKTIRRALFHSSGGVFSATFWNAGDDGSSRTFTYPNAPVKGTQTDLTMRARVVGGNNIPHLFHWLCSPPPASTECNICESSTTPRKDSSSFYFYLVVAALAVVFLILLVLAYRELKSNSRSQKAKTESDEVQNNENEAYYEELDLTQVPPAAPLHQREQGLPGEENSESRDSINSIYNYIPDN